MRWFGTVDLMRPITAETMWGISRVGSPMLSVAFANFAGSTSFGGAFARSIHGSWEKDRRSTSKPSPTRGWLDRWLEPGMAPPFLTRTIARKTILSFRVDRTILLERTEDSTPTVDRSGEEPGAWRHRFPLGGGRPC